MRNPYKISVIFGTRPEAIKLAPVVLGMKENPAFKCRVCVTAQHREMLDQVLGLFRIAPDKDLDLMQPNQSLADFTSRALNAIDAYLTQEQPDLVLVQGDTTTVFCASLAAFYHHIPVGHVEAGLRTGNLNAPWPEEANRVLTSRLTTLHFAPTVRAQLNLRREGVAKSRIVVTGNTVIDALLLAQKRLRHQMPQIPGLPDLLQPSRSHLPEFPKLVLITGHRRENWGRGFECICRAIAKLASRFTNVHFVYPVHLNPNVRRPVLRILGGITTLPGSNVHLLEPLPYPAFIALMSSAKLILTDSGGIQEEAPSLGKPVLVMRDTTERPEAIAAGWAKLVGTERDSIVRETSALLAKPATGEPVSKRTNPYGDGKAADRIVAACHQFLSARCKASV